MIRLRLVRAIATLVAVAALGVAPAALGRGCDRACGER